MQYRQPSALLRLQDAFGVEGKYDWFPAKTQIRSAFCRSLGPEPSKLQILLKDPVIKGKVGILYETPVVKLVQNMKTGEISHRLDFGKPAWGHRFSRLPV